MAVEHIMLLSPVVHRRARRFRGTAARPPDLALVPIDQAQVDPDGRLRLGASIPGARRPTSTTVFNSCYGLPYLSLKPVDISQQGHHTQGVRMRFSQRAPPQGRCGLDVARGFRIRPRSWYHGADRHTQGGLDLRLIAEFS